jgi:hypothetical protein
MFSATSQAAVPSPLRLIEVTTPFESPWIHVDGQGMAMYAKDF